MSTQAITGSERLAQVASPSEGFPGKEMYYGTFFGGLAIAVLFGFAPKLMALSNGAARSGGSKTEKTPLAPQGAMGSGV